MPFGNRPRKVTLWRQNGLGSDGFPAFLPPEELSVRWEDRQVLIKNESGADVLSSNSRVWLGVEVERGDYIFDGVSASLTPESTARKIVRTVNIPAVRGNKVERQAYLD
jgi:hypothetical protein